MTRHRSTYRNTMHWSWYVLWATVGLGCAVLAFMLGWDAGVWYTHGR